MSYFDIPSLSAGATGAFVLFAVLSKVVPPLLLKSQPWAKVLAAAYNAADEKIAEQQLPATSLTERFLYTLAGEVLNDVADDSQLSEATLERLKQRFVEGFDVRALAQKRMEALQG